MDTKSNLIQELSLGLQNELARRVVSGENMLVSLPGSFGEAFAVSDKNAYVIRERDSGMNAICDVFAYRLAGVRGAEVHSSANGGWIELQLAEPATDPEAVKVYFPSYDMGNFQAAAELLNSIAAKNSESAPKMAQSIGASGEACPGCGRVGSSDDVFCAQCGRQLRSVCSTCNSSSPLGTVFCTACGRNMVELDTSCPRCDARVQRWMSFCPDCGSLLGEKCASCGMAIVAGWKTCPHCGREFSSDRLDPNAARRLRAKMEAAVPSEKVAPPIFEEESTNIAPPVTSSKSEGLDIAAEHNNRGREYFDNENIEEAVEQFELAVKLDPGNASYHCNLAVAYDENDQDDLALKEYQLTLALDPNDLTALVCLGYMYNENDESEKAREVWNKVLTIAPDTAEAEEVRDNLRHMGEL